MTWQEIHEQFHDNWLLVEAIDAHSEAGNRIVNQMTIAGLFTNSKDAMHAYLEQHRADSSRELYVVHGSRKTLEIQERHWAQVRVAA